MNDRQKFILLATIILVVAPCSGLALADSTVVPAPIEISDSLNEYLSPFFANSHESERVELSSGAMASFENQLSMIENAQSQVAIETSSLKLDDAGRALLITLLHKAQSMTKAVFVDWDGRTMSSLENPKTHQRFQARLLVDYGSQKSYQEEDNYIFAMLEDAGVEVRYYNTKFISSVLLGYQDNRNLTLADDRVCLGNGVQDVCVQGKISRPALKSYLTFWNQSNGTYRGYYAEKVATPEAPKRIVDPHRTQAEIENRYKSDLKRYQRFISKARAFLTLDAPDAEFAARIANLRIQGKDALNKKLAVVSKDISFVSDRPGTSVNDYLVSQELQAHAKMPNSSCLIGVSVMDTNNSNAMICVNDSADFAMRMQENAKGVQK